MYSIDCFEAHNQLLLFFFVEGSGSALNIRTVDKKLTTTATLRKKKKEKENLMPIIAYESRRCYSTLWSSTMDCTTSTIFYSSSPTFFTYILYIFTIPIMVYSIIYWWKFITYPWSGYTKTSGGRVETTCDTFNIGTIELKVDKLFPYAQIEYKQFLCRAIRLTSGCGG